MPYLCKNKPYIQGKNSPKQDKISSPSLKQTLYIKKEQQDRMYFLTRQKTNLIHKERTPIYENQKLTAKKQTLYIRKEL